MFQRKIMNNSRTVVILAFVLAGSLLVASVQARGGTFNIEPGREATDTVELGVSDSIVGNVSVCNGRIDFYILDPSGVTILCCNKTSFESFNLTAKEKGVYTIHLVNNYEAGNVTILLDYGANFNLVLYGSINLSTSTGVATVVAGPIPLAPFDWLEFFAVTSSYVELVVAGLIGLWKRWKDRNWKKKYEKVVVTIPAPV